MPRKVWQTTSPISGQIVVEEQLGQYSLSVQGLTQSGGLVKTIWAKPIKLIASHLSPIAILILGLGGGTVAHLIVQRWPQAQITGLEIDPKIIKISKKYFGLNKISNLKIINADAFKWLALHYNNIYHCSGYDLIIVDLYLGSKFPKQAESLVFLKQLKKILSSDGMVIFNRLWASHTRCDIGRHFGYMSAFGKKLNKTFNQVDLFKTRTNWFFIGRQ